MRSALKYPFYWSLGFLLVILSVDIVEAKEVTASWTAPTTREDGSALQASEITGYEVRFNRTAEPDMSWKRVGVLAPAETTYRYTLTTPGSHCMTVRTLAGDLRSAWAQEACVEFSASAPAAPTIELRIK